MRTTRLWLDANLSDGAEIQLSAEQAHYIQTVLRLRSGDPLEVFDGHNHTACAELQIYGKKSASVILSTVATHSIESPLKITLVQGISRGERMDFTLQKATELGIHEIQPVFTERTEVKLKGEKLTKRIEHWQKIVINACEQCGRNSIPQVLPAINFKDWAACNTLPTFVLHHRDSQTLKQLTQPESKFALAIGPEGGLAEHEIELLKNNKAQGLKLGPRILRTETAALTALAAMQSHWGDLS